VAPPTRSLSAVSNRATRCGLYCPRISSEHYGHSSLPRRFGNSFRFDLGGDHVAYRALRGERGNPSTPRSIPGRARATSFRRVAPTRSTGCARRLWNCARAAGLDAGGDWATDVQHATKGPNSSLRSPRLRRQSPDPHFSWIRGKNRSIIRKRRQVLPVISI